MWYQKDKLQQIARVLDSIIETVFEFENKYHAELEKVHPEYELSAKNLVHYLGLRSFNINILQEMLEDVGLPVSLESQDNVLYHLLSLQTIVHSLMGDRMDEGSGNFLSNKEVKTIVQQNSTIFSII